MHGSQGAPAQQCAGATQLAEDRADGVRATAGDGAQPGDRRGVLDRGREIPVGSTGLIGARERGRNGGGEGADRGVEQQGDLVDPRGQLVELAQQQPGQLGVVVGEPAVQGPFQIGPAGAGPAPGQLGQHHGVALPGD
jgi:hypothetical protein